MMKKTLMMVLFLFVLFGCTNESIPMVEQTPEPTPVEPIPTEPIPTEVPLTFDELFLMYKVFIDAHLFDQLIVTTPYYRISSRQEVVTKDELDPIYQAIDHQAVQLNYSNIYYLHLFHYIDVYFQTCDTSGSSFTCTLDSWEVFRDITADVIVDGNHLTIEVHMYQDWDGHVVGHHTYYTFDLIEDKIHITAGQFQTTDDVELSNEIITYVYVDIVQDESFEIIYRNQTNNMFFYHLIDATEQNEINYTNSTEYKGFYYTDSGSNIKQEYGSFGTPEVFKITSYFVDGAMALQHFENWAGHVYLYNMMMVDGWQSMTRSSDANSILSLALDEGVFNPTSNAWFRTDIYNKIMLELIRSGNTLEDLTVDLSDLSLSFTAITQAVVESKNNTFIFDIEAVMASYGFNDFETTSMPGFDILLAPMVEASLAHHQNQS